MTHEEEELAIREAAATAEGRVGEINPKLVPTRDTKKLFNDRPHYGGGEGMDPVENDQGAMEGFHQEQGKQAIDWYHTVEVASWHRTNETKQFTPSMVPDNWDIKRAPVFGIRAPSTSRF